MVIVSQLDLFQATFGLWFIGVLGAVVAFFKVFTENNVFHIRRLILLIPVPCMIIREIGNSARTTKECWMIFLQQLLIQVVLHIFAFVYALAYRKGLPLMQRFTECCFMFCETEFFAYCYVLGIHVYKLPTDTIDYNHIIFTAVMSAIVHYVITDPIHNILSLRYFPNAVGSFRVPFDYLVDPPKTDEQEVLDPNENKRDIDTPDTNENPENLEQPEQEALKIGPTGNPIPVHTVDAEKEDNLEEISKSERPEDVPDTSEPEQKKPFMFPWQKNWNEKYCMLYCIINAPFVATFLGLIWEIQMNFTNQRMPLWLFAVFRDLEKALIGSTLWIIGFLMYHHPIKGCPIIDVVVSCVSHLIIQPLLSILFALALQLNREFAQFLIFANCCPISLHALHQIYLCGQKYTPASYASFYVNILTIPAFCAWHAAINHLKIFV